MANGSRNHASPDGSDGLSNRWPHLLGAAICVSETGLHWLCACLDRSAIRVPCNLAAPYSTTCSTLIPRFFNSSMYGSKGTSVG